MMPFVTFEAFLLALRDRAQARLCGSYSRGTEDMGDHVSDIDLVVPCVDREDAWGDSVERPIDRAVEVFKLFGVPMESILPGQVSSPRDLKTLPRPVEVMDTAWVDPEAGALPSREVFGVVFETHRDELWANAIAAAALEGRSACS